MINIVNDFVFVFVVNGTSALLRLLVPRTVEMKTYKTYKQRFETDQLNI